MSFGKSNKPQRRHRPKKVVEEVDQDELREKREAKMNAPIIGTVISVIGSIVMLGIVVMGAPYTYGSSPVRYSKSELKQSARLADVGKTERDEADPKLLIDFTTVIVTPKRAQSAAMKKVAGVCRQGRAATLEAITPDKANRALQKATKHLTCAMATERSRFCHAEERKLLVEQLIAYKERRQNVFAFEKYRDKAIVNYEAFRESQRLAGASVPASLEWTYTSTTDPTFDQGLLRQLENLVSNGYLSPTDFGYYGLYVPTEYRDAITGGADRYPVCTTKS